MATITALLRLSADTDRLPSRYAVDLRTLARKIFGRLFDSYRPERHYMRGPGPRWHAKHGPTHDPEH